MTAFIGEAEITAVRSWRDANRDDALLTGPYVQQGDRWRDINLLLEALDAERRERSVLAAIVRDLAAKEPLVITGHSGEVDECGCCEASNDKPYGWRNVTPPPLVHTESCAFARAVAWVTAHGDPQ